MVDPCGIGVSRSQEHFRSFIKRFLIINFKTDKTTLGQTVPCKKKSKEKLWKSTHSVDWLTKNKRGDLCPGENPESLFYVRGEEHDHTAGQREKWETPWE